MTLDYDESCWLDDALRLAVDDWERSRDEYWSEGVGEGMVSFGQLADDLAIAVLDGTTGLVKPSTLKGLSASFGKRGFSSIHQILALPELRRLGLERLEIGLTRRHGLAWRSMAERAMDLAPLVFEEEPSPAVHRYLPRMARAYVIGLDLEVVIIARSVLESVVRDWYVARSHDPPETMKKRLQFLQTCRVLTVEEFKNAWAIWLRGNRAIHEGEAPSEGSRGTIETTLGLVRTIEGIE